jgi:hypothetical protein
MAKSLFNVLSKSHKRAPQMANDHSNHSSR